MRVALLAEGVDRNSRRPSGLMYASMSPSSRRAWIEISSGGSSSGTHKVALLAEGVDRNACEHTLLSKKYVALLAEGVDRNRSRSA